MDEIGQDFRVDPVFHPVGTLYPIIILHFISVHLCGERLPACEMLGCNCVMGRDVQGEIIHCIRI